jgi:hypothetical protein
VNSSAGSKSWNVPGLLNCAAKAENRQESAYFLCRAQAGVIGASVKEIWEDCYPRTDKRKLGRWERHFREARTCSRLFKGESKK